MKKKLQHFKILNQKKNKKKKFKKWATHISKYTRKSNKKKLFLIYWWGIRIRTSSTISSSTISGSIITSFVVTFHEYRYGNPNNVIWFIAMRR